LVASLVFRERAGASRGRCSLAVGFRFIGGDGGIGLFGIRLARRKRRECGDGGC
jgi:hypothetical protein